MSIRFENTVTPSPEQWKAAIMGARNPLNSWQKSDSEFEECDHADVYYPCVNVGQNDLDLMKRLCKAGTDHRKFMRMLSVIVTITAPLYWWKEFDTYKVGTVANSCSTMHKIHSKPIELSDFSMDNGLDELQGYTFIVSLCEILRKKYVETNDKKYWRALIQLLPESYNQKRTIMLNYEVLANIYKSRKGHKLDEWNKFCDWIEELPYSELITGGNGNAS